MRKLTKLIALLLFVCWLTACTQTTTGIWKNATYMESINLFMTTRDHSELVFIGEKHHYIFQNTSSLSDILTWEDRELLRGRFSTSFFLDSSNRITGSYAIVCLCRNISQEQLQWLEQRGFGKPTDEELTHLGGSVTYLKKGEIHGTRYSSGDIEFRNVSSLNSAYMIEVETEHSSAGKVGRATLTPVAVAEDGVATVGLGALLIIAVPFWAADKVVND